MLLLLKLIVLNLWCIMVLCRYWLRGNCFNGRWCRYSHFLSKQDADLIAAVMIHQPQNEVENVASGSAGEEIEEQNEEQLVGEMLAGEEIEDHNESQHVGDTFTFQGEAQVIGQMLCLSIQVPLVNLQREVEEEIGQTSTQRHQSLHEGSTSDGNIGGARPQKRPRFQTLHEGSRDGSTGEVRPEKRTFSLEPPSAPPAAHLLLRTKN